ncbi:SDR family NAD(P)-dependent oxidoreductase, partial [Nocardia sp. bgisy118]|uniref:SDR family NAD(P)-dependent oxidoreductase n=1 Tax=Nocardia sp. bgisy118 TaxID=3413786 RepID=UPI003F4A3B85
NTTISTAGAFHDRLFQVDWVNIPANKEQPQWGLLGSDLFGVAAGRPDISQYSSIEDLQEAVETGAALDTVLACRASDIHEDLVETVHQNTIEVLNLLQAWLSADCFMNLKLVIVTRGAVPARHGEAVEDLANAPVWGLVRSAQSENPGRFTLVDIDAEDLSLSVLPATAGIDEPQLAIRDGVVVAPRLAAVTSNDALALPAGPRAWRLDNVTAGTIEGLSIVQCPEVLEPLKEGQVRLAVHAAGINFRDIMIALDVVAGLQGIGGEAAGMVLEVGPGVADLAVGDRVMGFCGGSFGPVAVADHRLLVKMPEGWRFDKAASIPIAYVTAYYGLVDLAEVQPGESVLIHAAAGGVGTAAVQLTRYLGAEVYATASPQKWRTLRDAGLDGKHIANSRTLDFEERFLEATDGRGVDVVIDCLANDFVDAGLRLLDDGGRFLEIGKTDKRDPVAVSEQYPGVSYQAYDVHEAGPARIQEILRDVVSLIDRDVIKAPQITAWDVRRGRDAFRALSQARLVGKAVVNIPHPLNTQGTALITGGTGALGRQVARHLVARHGMRNLLVVSRQGIEAKRAREMEEELTALDATVGFATCDVADRGAVAELLAGIPDQHPLVAVVHAAGVLDDGTTGSLTSEQVGQVLRPKVDGAWNLHELTQDLPLSMFTLFSSAAGTFGNAGQGNYAAANTFLDALAHQRRARGLPALSLAWGLWAESDGMVRDLADLDTGRFERSGMSPLSHAEGLALFDAAHAIDQPVVAPLRVNVQLFRRAADTVPHLLRGLIGESRKRPEMKRALAGGGLSLGKRLSALPKTERDQMMADLVRSHTALVLGMRSAESITGNLAFADLGLDSLTAVELRNRLAQDLDITLPASLLFDHPTFGALTEFLGTKIAPDELSEIDRIESDLETFDGRLALLAPGGDDRKRIFERLNALARKWEPVEVDDVDLDTASNDDLFDLIDREFGTL